MRKIILYICLLMILLSCTTQEQYTWITSNEGLKIWVKESESMYSYSWDGDDIEGVANGVGNLQIYQNGSTRVLSNINIFYGAINYEGIIEVSPSEKYIGEIEEKQYNGFGILFKGKDILIGQFLESNANGYCAYYKNENIVYRGMWKGHQLHGEGVQYNQGDSICGIWDNGKLISAKISQNTKSGRFSGYIENNLPNGQGTMEYVNGWTYVGNWENGNWSGEGELTTPEFVYSGEWVTGIPQGEGLVKYTNGCSYDGTWNLGKRNGWGEAYNIDSSYYQGEWVEGEYAGQGTLYFADGSVYDGQWSNGLQHGLGSYTSEDFHYVGQWEEGWINGEGRIEYNNGDYYEGNFVENQRYGLGSYHFHEGNSYEGEFVDDKLSGLGTFYFQDGSFYEGEFLDGKICGDGTFYYIEGNDTIAITAEWNGTNAFPTQASILFANGDIYEGEILNGRPTSNGVWYPYEKKWLHDNVVAANDYYKLHKETIDKVVTWTSISLAVVAGVASLVASCGTTAPALVACASTVSSVANTTSTIINVADVTVTISSSAIDGEWDGVAKEVAMNAAFLLVPKAVTKVLQSNPARKAAAKLSSSAIAIAKGARKSVITITTSKPFKKISKVVVEKSGNIKRKFISATKKNLEKFAKKRPSTTVGASSQKMTKSLKNVFKNLAKNLDKDVKKFQGATDYATRSKAIRSIKKQLDNTPELPEKQKIFDALPDEIKRKLNRMWGGNYKYDNIPKSAKGQGKWVGERGNSRYQLDKNKIPNSKNHNNTRNLSMEDILKENNCQDGVNYLDGYIDLSPYEIANVEMDYTPYINDLLKKSPNRQNLHEGAFKKIAEKLGKSIDEVKVMKGDSDAARRLSKQWGCSENEVFKRCGNPNKRQYVWHEEPDCKTLRLVPRELHANLKHNGGIKMFRILNDIFD